MACTMHLTEAYSPPNLETVETRTTLRDTLPQRLI
jgi:hypothetical protein